MMKLTFLASNNGSGMRAIVAAIADGDLAAEARLVVSNRRSAPALDYATAAGIPTVCIPTSADPNAADGRVAEVLSRSGANRVILSGSLRTLGPATLRAF